MDKDAVLAAIGGPGLVAIFRTPSVDGVFEACESLLDSGIRAVEITLTIPGALPLITSLADHFADRLAVGAGTVLDRVEAWEAVNAGAAFVVSPGFDPDIVDACVQENVVSMPGCLSPTEVMLAQRAGADVVKLFPARVAGPEFVADLLGPLPRVRLMPTGGINPSSAAAFIRAGAFAVGVGGRLVDARSIRSRDAGAIGRAAAELLRAVDGARAAA
jgi:2-dehydro-3-deoxyphosphogluconate aldolase/(4S)-4-hydroxy-2-oxoglutarate aldolase